MRNWPVKDLKTKQKKEKNQNIKALPDDKLENVAWLFFFDFFLSQKLVNLESSELGELEQTKNK